MADRVAISARLRFEVFKRDKFTCQYCGKSAPEIVLQVDHIEPVVLGGSNDLLNLVASCARCNGGKGGVPLSDDTAVSKQVNMLADLEERRHQLEMLLQWRDELQSIQQDGVNKIADRFEERTSYALTESARGDLRKWIKDFSFAHVLKAMDEALDTYAQYEGDSITRSSASSCFKKVPGIARTIRSGLDKPYLRRLFYIQGIVRKCVDDPDVVCLELLEHIHLAGEGLDDLERFVKTVRYPSHILGYYSKWLASVGRPYTKTDKGFTYRSSYTRRD